LQDEGIRLRTCSKCGKPKDPGDFKANRRMRDGLSSWCRRCHNDATARWRERKRVRLTREELEQYRLKMGSAA